MRGSSLLLLQGLHDSVHYFVGTTLTLMLRATPNARSYNRLLRYAIQYLTRNWGKLGGFNEAFSGVDMEKMREAVQPLLVAEGVFDKCASPLVVFHCRYQNVTWFASMTSYRPSLSIPCAAVATAVLVGRSLVFTCRGTASTVMKSENTYYVYTW